MKNKSIVALFSGKLSFAYRRNIGLFPRSKTIRCLSLLCGLVVATLFPFLALADDGTRAEQAKVIVDDVLEIKAFVDANGIFCEAFSTKHGPTVTVAIADWYRDNRIDNVINVIYGNLKSTRGGQSLASRMQARNLNDLETKVRSRANDWCARFPTTLQSEKMNLAVSYTEKLQELNSYYNQIRAGHLKSENTIAPTARSLSTIESPSYQALVNAKINPSSTPIATEFRCYGLRPGADFSAPDFIVQLATSNAYKSTYGAGSYVGVVNDKGRLTRNLTWTGALSSYRSSSLKNNYKYGQTITFRSLEINGFKQDFSCYQQGASERAAITRFMLKEPVVGEYSCRDSEGKSRKSFALIQGYRYRAGDQAGDYRVDLRSSNSSDSEVSFVSGPLADTSGDYKEQVGTGRRTFTFTKVSSNFLSQSSSSSLDMICTSVGEATGFQKFGDESVPAAPLGSGGISGLFAVERKFDAAKPNKFGFYVFTSEGRVFDAEPDMAVDNIKCVSTHPSGRPRCNTYRIDGAKIILNNGFRDYATLSQDKLISVSADVTQLDGIYSATIGGAQGLCVQYFSCSSWIKERTRQFSSDGRFSKNGSSMSTISSSLGPSTAFGSGSSNSSDSGRYKIAGNRIHFEYGNGVVETAFIAVLGENKIHTGGWTYYLDNE